MTLSRRHLAGLPLLLAAGTAPGIVLAQPAPVRLFTVVGARDSITVGLTAAELDSLGTGPDAERLARKLVAEGQIGAWAYAVSRAPDGSTRYATTRRIAILRQTRCGSSR